MDTSDDFLGGPVAMDDRSMQLLQLMKSNKQIFQLLALEKQITDLCNLAADTINCAGCNVDEEGEEGGEGDDEGGKKVKPPPKEFDLARFRESATNYIKSVAKIEEALRFNIIKICTEAPHNRTCYAEEKTAELGLDRAAIVQAFNHTSAGYIDRALIHLDAVSPPSKGEAEASSPKPAP
eukprot:Nk52_evm16s367 gene=Nk52_evmTU16s367